MATSLDPRIIVLALGAGALGFPDALRFLLRDVAGRSPLMDIAICVFAIAVVTAQALGAMLLARFVRKAAARAGGDDANAPSAPTSPRTDGFAQVTLVVSLGVAFLVSACLLVAPGAGGLGLLHLVADVARNSPVIAVLATAAAVLLCTGPLLRVAFREEDRSHGTGTGRIASMAQVASFAGAAAAFLIFAVSGGLYTQRGSFVGVAVFVGTVLVARVTFTRKARNAAGAGGRTAPASPAETQRFCGKLTRPYLAVVSFAVICLVLTNVTAPRSHDKTLLD